MTVEVLTKIVIVILCPIRCIVQLKSNTCLQKYNMHTHLSSAYALTHSQTVVSTYVDKRKRALITQGKAKPCSVKHLVTNRKCIKHNIKTRFLC